MKAQEPILFRDISTVARFREKTSLEFASPSLSGPRVLYTRSILLPRIARWVRLGKDVSGRRESRLSRWLKLSVNSLMVGVMRVEILDKPFDTSDKEVSDGKRFDNPLIFFEVSLSYSAGYKGKQYLFPTKQRLVQR